MDTEYSERMGCLGW